MSLPGKPHNSLSPSQVRCVAEGGRPAPSFAWKLDDEDYAGDSDNPFEKEIEARLARGEVYTGDGMCDEQW